MEKNKGHQVLEQVTVTHRLNLPVGALRIGGVQVTATAEDLNSPGGGGSYEVPTGDVDGVNDEFTFTAPPILIFRNGVMERRLGSIAANVFTFDTPPDIGDDIEGLV